MWPDRVSNPGPLTYESGALLTALRGLAPCIFENSSTVICWACPFIILGLLSLFCRFDSVFDGKSC